MDGNKENLGFLAAKTCGLNMIEPEISGANSCEATRDKTNRLQPTVFAKKLKQQRGTKWAWHVLYLKC